MEKPGHCGEEIMEVWETLFYLTAKFINNLHGRVADIGCVNAKSVYIAAFFNHDIEQVVSEDFNFWTFPRWDIEDYDFVLCLEVLEHLQNPLHFMKNVKLMLKPGGVLYLSLPARPRFLWTEHHFFEMNKKHLTKWILAPLGLKIVDCKRIRLGNPWWFYFSGVRPFLRIFFNHTFIYKIVIVDSRNERFDIK